MLLLMSRYASSFDGYQKSNSNFRVEFCNRASVRNPNTSKLEQKSNRRLCIWRNLATKDLSTRSSLSVPPTSGCTLLKWQILAYENTHLSLMSPNCQSERERERERLFISRPTIYSGKFICFQTHRDRNRLHKIMSITVMADRYSGPL